MGLSRRIYIQGWWEGYAAIFLRSPCPHGVAFMGIFEYVEDEAIDFDEILEVSGVDGDNDFEDFIEHLYNQEW